MTALTPELLAMIQNLAAREARRYRVPAQIAGLDLRDLVAEGQTQAFAALAAHEITPVTAPAYLGRAIHHAVSHFVLANQAPVSCRRHSGEGQLIGLRAQALGAWRSDDAGEEFVERSQVAATNQLGTEQRLASAQMTALRARVRARIAELHGPNAEYVIDLITGERSPTYWSERTGEPAQVFRSDANRYKRELQHDGVLRRLVLDLDE